jgi:hypothetical protein
VYFSVNESFLATITNPINTPYNTTDLTVNVSTNANADTCLIDLDSKGNSTMDNTSATAWYYDLSSLSESAHNLSVWCNNSAGTLSSTATGLFTIDLTKPTITVTSPANTTYGTTVVFNATTDETVASCTYSLDGATNTTMSGSTTVWSKSNTSMTNGAHNVNFYCNDLAGNINSTATTYFTVDATPPVLTIYSPINTTYGSTSILVNLSADENLSTCSVCDAHGCGVVPSMNAPVYSTTLTNVSEGQHNYTISCSDLYGNSAGQDITLRVDLTPPTVTLTTPANNTWSQSGTVDFKFNVGDVSNIATCRLNTAYASTDNGTAVSKTSVNTINQAMASPIENDNIYWYVNCTDTAGNTGMSATRILKADDQIPDVSIDYPANSQQFNTRMIPINVSTLETYPAKLKVNANSVVVYNGNYSSGSSEKTINYTFPADGTYNLTAFANDSAGNNNSASLVSIFIDSTAPVITNVTAVNITNSSAGIIAITNENSSCTLYHGTDSSSLSSDGTMGLFVFMGGPNHDLTLNSLDEGTLYYHKVSCNDRLGNNANSSIYNFTTEATQTATINNATPTNITINNTENGVESPAVQIEVVTNTTVNATINFTPLNNNPTNATFSVPRLGTYYSIESQGLNGSNIKWMIITVYYNDSDIPAGVNESKLRLYWYNNTSGSWEIVNPGGVDTVNNYIWGNTTHFSLYALAEEKVTETPTQGGGGGGLGGGGGMPSVGANYTTNLDTAIASEQSMKVNDVVAFILGGGQHSAKLLSLTSISAVVEVSSKPINVTLLLGLPTKVDVNGDGSAELKLMLTSVTNGVANITFENIATVITTGQAVTPITPAGPVTGITGGVSPVKVAENVPSAVTDVRKIVTSIAVAAAIIGLIIYAIRMRKEEATLPLSSVKKARKEERVKPTFSSVKKARKNF